MNWIEFLNYDILNIGDFHLRVGKLALVVIIFLSTVLVLWIIRRMVERPNSVLSSIDKKRRHSIYLLAKYFIWVLSMVFMFEAIGLKVSLLLAGSAALLVGIGFGLQSIFADLVAGLFLLFEGTIKIGDVIEADGIVGKVHEINLRSSHVLTRENVIIIVPNSKFVSDKVINWSHNAESVRFSVGIGVSYSSDVESVMIYLHEVMTANDIVEKTPKPFVRFTNFGDSSLDFELIFWTLDPFTVENLKSDLRRAIHARLKKEGVSIPFPQRDLHIISADGLKTKTNN